MERSSAEVLPLVTVLQPYGEQDGTECGYCHSKTPERVAYGMVAKSCTCVDYQALCDAGWRRSGTYVYLPTNSKTCCPNITIRLDVTKFQATKDQNRIVRNLHRFLAGELDDAPAASEVPAAEPSSSVAALPESHDAPVNNALRRILVAAAISAFPVLAEGDLAGVNVTPLSTAAVPTVTAAAGAAVPPLTHVSNVAFIVCAALNKARGIRRAPQRPTAASAEGGATQAVDPPPDSKPLRPADVATAIASASCDAYSAVMVASLRAEPARGSVTFVGAPSGHLNVAVVGGVIGGVILKGDPDSPEPAFFELLRASDAGSDGGGASGGASSTDARKRARKGGGGGGAPGRGAANPAGAPASAAHSWRVDMVPAGFDDEAFELYKRYQVAVHGDTPEEVTPDGYRRFLCASPLLPEPFGAPRGRDLLRRPSEFAPPGIARVDRTTLSSLVEMGFSEAAAAAALDQAHGDAAVALEALIRDADGAESESWTSPAAQSLRRCAAAVSAAWRDGEGGGAGVPLLAPSAMAAAALSAEPLAPPAVSYAGFREGHEHVFPDLPMAPMPGVLGASAPGGAATPPSASASLLALGYGSFHQRYYLDGRLVAVGVVDVLPHCLSSVYLFYDPALGRRLQLGKLTALREIQWVQAAMAASPRLRYYYMGYYVHACPKMRYKAEYAPSDLRCPVTGLWVPLAACVARLDADKHAALADESPAEAEERRRRDSAALAALLPAVPIILGGGGGGDSLLLLRELNKRGQGILVGILRELLPRLGGLSGGGLASRVVAFVR